MQITLPFSMQLTHFCLSVLYKHSIDLQTMIDLHWLNIKGDLCALLKNQRPWETQHLRDRHKKI